jgi:hypothetical protein
MKKIILVALLSLLVVSVFAQQRRTKKHDTKKQETQAIPQVKSDTLPQRTVTVTSAFKPTLKTTSKINLNATTPAPDTTRHVLQYDVPTQNIIFSYLSPPLKPLAQKIDTNIHWENNSFVKAGYGNFTTPYLQAGVAMGNGVESVINLHGKYTSSKGPIPYQQFSKTSLDAIGIFSSPDNKKEWSGKVFYDNNTQYEYGFSPDTLKFAKEDLRQSFTTFGGNVALRNKTQNAAGINYNPGASLSLFQDNHGGKENTFSFTTPMSKSFGKAIAFNLGLNADITTYKSDSAGTINNNLYYLTPAVAFKTPNFKLVAGITPSWDNSVFNFLPNISAEAKLQDERFILQAGWVGYYNKTTYQYLASINPWLQQPKFLLNTKIKEQYAGFKGSAGTHVTYEARVSYLQFTNQPLFVNDTITGKSFFIVNESQMKDIRIHGEIGYTMAEKLSLLAGATFNQYSSLKDNAKAWGLVPLELNGSIRWQIIKEFLVKSEIYFWDGAHWRNKLGDSRKLQPAADVNVGVEFTILPQLNGWVQVNNLFNNKYERWNQYPVLGFNVLAGIVYTFGDIKTALKK